MFDIPEDLIKKYSVSGPRYTSYPTVPVWGVVDGVVRKQWLAESKDKRRPLSIYIHIPFCYKRCFYCGCNTVIGERREALEYVEYIAKELEELATLTGEGKLLRQLHFGGGTPNFLLDEEFRRIFDKIHSLFAFEENAEISIETNPGDLRPGQLEFLVSLGINRLSLGVQDLDPKVQKAVNRVQSKELTEEVLKSAVGLGVRGINFDLIYGLPFQTPESFQKTVAEVIEMRPDRLAVYNFAWLPQLMPHQKKIDAEALPDTKTKMKIFLNTIKQFADAGYQYIGMDHFALPEDELSLAQKNRTLHRSFMGYTPRSGSDLAGIGATAISEFENFFAQNQKDLASYKERIDSPEKGVFKGIRLSLDDRIRKWTIQRLICHFHLSFEEFRQEFGISFRDYFSDELEELKPVAEDGLLGITPDSLVVLDPGKILVRNVCMIFDSYLKKQKAGNIRFSKTI